MMIIRWQMKPLTGSSRRPIVYAEILNNFLTHLKTKPAETFFVVSNENSKQMRVEYQRLGSVSAFIDWLQAKVMEEAMGSTDGAFFVNVGVPNTRYDSFGYGGARP